LLGIRFTRVTTWPRGCKEFAGDFFGRFATWPSPAEGPRKGGSETVQPIAVQAHRGSPDATADIPENTLRAFARARHLGAQGVELDVRLTADGALAVHHDPVVEGAGPVHELRAADLPPDVPLLGAVLEECRGLTVNVEVKNLPGEPGFDPSERCASAVGEVVAASGRAGSVVVSSFWPGSLEALHGSSPEIATGLLVARSIGSAGMVEAAVRLGCGALHPHADLVDSALVEEAHAAGLAVAVWTVNDRSRLEGVAGAGVDTVITDDVLLAVEVLASR
jgi:glycerophosphoryl diester phosphodiesterase